VLPIAIAKCCSNDDNGIGSPLHQNVLFLYSDALAEKSFTGRSLIDQSKFQRSDWRKRKRERNLLRICWTVSRMDISSERDYYQRLAKRFTFN